MPITSSRLISIPYVEYEKIISVAINIKLTGLRERERVAISSETDGVLKITRMKGGAVYFADNS